MQMQRREATLLSHVSLVQLQITYTQKLASQCNTSICAPPITLTYESLKDELKM